MIIEKIKASFTLINLLKFVCFIILLLFLSGMGVGFVNIWQARQEKSDIKAVNTLLEDQGVSDEVKKLITKFMNKYQGTKNIIICDNNSNIVFKANDQIIGDIDKFELKPDREMPNISRLKESPIWFAAIPKKIEPFSLIPRSGAVMRSGESMMMDKRYYFSNKGGEAGRKGIKQDLLFINSFSTTTKGLNIYYISGHFKENKLIEMLFASHELLRLLILIFWILLAVWVYRDSKARGLHEAFWGLLTLFSGLVGLMIYLIMKHRMKFCSICNMKVEKGSSYCQEFGSALRNECPSCKNMMDLKYNYCTCCGTKREER